MEASSKRTRPLQWAPIAILAALVVLAGQSGAQPRLAPRMQVVPLPNAEGSFQRDGDELARYR